MDIHMRDEDLIALNEFIQFFLTRTLIHVADEDIAEWTALMNRALAIFGYRPNTYGSAVCERCGDNVRQLRTAPERRLS
jgi:hypothetical protein